jgi:hypothetical protein
MVSARSRARDRSARPLARRLLATIALSLAASLGVGTASALAGPGILLGQGGSSPQFPLTGGQIAAAADTGPNTYTVRKTQGGPSTKITLHGLSIAGLLRGVGFEPADVNFVQVVGEDGGVITLSKADINSPPFAEGPALIADNGSTTTFFRPVRGAGDTSDLVRSVSGQPLEITVNGGSLLSVKVSPDPRTGKVGQTFTFTATVQAPPPGASFQYVWNFDDGQTATGQTVTHRFTAPGDYQARVEVTGTGGTNARCSGSCGGPGHADVTVTGRQRSPDQTQGTPLGGGTAGGGTGTGGTGGGTGTGNGSGLTGGAGGSNSTSRRRAPTPRAERPEPREPFSSDPASGEGKTIIEGVLLQGSGRVLAGGLPQSKGGGTPKPAQGTPGTAGNASRVVGGVLLALAVVSMGALQERRRVRLRLA